MMVITEAVYLVPTYAEDRIRYIDIRTADFDNDTIRVDVSCDFHLVNHPANDPSGHSSAKVSGCTPEII